MATTVNPEGHQSGEIKEGELIKQEIETHSELGDAQPVKEETISNETKSTFSRTTDPRTNSSENEEDNEEIEKELDELLDSVSKKGNRKTILNNVGRSKKSLSFEGSDLRSLQVSSLAQSSTSYRMNSLASSRSSSSQKLYRESLPKDLKPSRINYVGGKDRPQLKKEIKEEKLDGDFSDGEDLLGESGEEEEKSNVEGADEYDGEDYEDDDDQVTGSGMDMDDEDESEDWHNMASKAVNNLLGVLRYFLGPTLDEIIVDIINYGNICIQGINPTENDNEEDLSLESDESPKLAEKNLRSEFSEVTGMTLKSTGDIGTLNRRHGVRSPRPLLEGTDISPRRRKVPPEITTTPQSLPSSPLINSKKIQPIASPLSGRNNQLDNYNVTPKVKRSITTEASGDKLVGSLRMPKSGVQTLKSSKQGNWSITDSSKSSKATSKVSFKDPTGEKGETFSETGTDSDAGEAVKSFARTSKHQVLVNSKA